MTVPIISLVITDLENTLYDWLSAVVPPFYAMAEAAAPLLGVAEVQLLGDLQQVHRKHGDLEHPFALLETQVAQWRLGPLPRRDLERHLAPAFHAFKQARQKSLRLYPGVREALVAMARMRVRVVGCTDSRGSETMFRLNRLGIKELLTAVYVPQRAGTAGEALPATGGFLRQLPPRLRRPDPRTLLEICRRFEVAPDNALYIGDSGALDIEMGKKAGLHTAWSRYGATSDATLWAKLLRVAPWTEAEAARMLVEQQTPPATPADCTLDRFEDVLPLFDFRPSYTKGEWWGFAAPGNTL